MTTRIYLHGLLNSDFDTITTPHLISSLPEDFDTTTKIKPHNKDKGSKVDY